jgi:TPR repeat protein
MAALERACTSDRLTACHHIGVLRVKDPATRDAGWGLLAQNCRRGHVPSCSIVAYATAPLISVTSNCAQSLNFADRACAGGQANACAVVMACRLQTLGGDQSTANQLHDACTHRVSLACLYWADVEERRAKQHPLPDQVVYAYNAACRGGFPAAEVACARAAAIALDRAPDAAEAEAAISSLQRACSNSSREACCAVGDAYRDGKGVTADPQKAKTFRAKACEQGLARCCEGAAAPPARP